ncbi:MAG: GlxA family transcriptional regulator [Sporichthyaceae bacterium]
MRRVLIVAHPGALGMELLGCRDILEMANELFRREGRPDPYLVELATVDGADVELWGGLRLGPVRNLCTTRVAVDTLLVVGGPVAHEVAAADPGLAAAVAKVSRRARRTVGVCTGSFILAAAGLLEGRRCTTHWLMTGEFAASFPQLRVEADPIYVQDGNVWTSAGVTSGYDLLLSLVEADVGAETARSIAQLLVLYLRRSGNQAQFSAQMAAQTPQREPLRDLLQFVAEHPAADLSLAALAARVSMSPRHFTRVFTAEVGVSPGRYVDRIRVETARRLLETDGRDLEAVARAAGFGNQQGMRRAFAAALGIGPAEYRRRFGAQPTALHLAV